MSKSSGRRRGGCDGGVTNTQIEEEISEREKYTNKLLIEILGNNQWSMLDIQ